MPNGFIVKNKTVKLHITENRLIDTLNFAFYSFSSIDRMAFIFQSAKSVGQVPH